MADFLDRDPPAPHWRRLPWRAIIIRAVAAAASYEKGESRRVRIIPVWPDKLGRTPTAVRSALKRHVQNHPHVSAGYVVRTTIDEEWRDGRLLPCVFVWATPKRPE